MQSPQARVVDLGIEQSHTLQAPIHARDRIERHGIVVAVAAAVPTAIAATVVAAAAAAERWTAGMEWDELVARSKAEPGDLVRLLSRTGEALRQVAHVNKANAAAAALARQGGIAPADLRAIEAAAVAGPITDGTVLKRAPNDVGGLLDTSKGWTLTIPAPGESSQSTRAIAQQQQADAAAKAKAAQNEAATQTRVIAAR